MNIGKESLDRIHGGEDVSDVIQEFIEDNLFSESIVGVLARYCERAGYPDEEGDFEPSNFNVSHISEDSFYGSVNIYFEEIYFGSGCPDMPTREPREGKVYFDVNLASGNIEVRRTEAIKGDHPDFEY